MAFKDFFNENKKIIIIILLLIIAFVVYRYFWEQKSIEKDFSISNLESRIDELESAIGINPSFHPPSSDTTNVPIAPGTQPIIHGQTLKPMCLDKATQQQIADDINKKLKEINACDCRQTCALYNNNNTIGMGNMGANLGPTFGSEY